MSYETHARILAGEDIPISEANPIDGFWRKKVNGSWAPVGIWLDGEAFKVWVDGATYDDYARVLQEWRLCCRYPVTAEAWFGVVQHGKQWPDVPPADEPAGIGHNLPTDPVERFKVLLDQEAEKLTPFLESPIVDEDTATQCGLWSQKIAALGKDVEAERKARKKPHDDAVKEIQAMFTPLSDRADRMVSALKRHMEAYLQEKARKARAEEAARREAEQARLAAAAEKVGVEPPPAPPPAAPSRGRVVTGGVTIRTKKEVVFTDYAAAFAHAVKDPAFAKQDAVIKIVRGMAEYTIGVRKEEFPGAKIETREYAA